MTLVTIKCITNDPTMTLQCPYNTFKPLGNFGTRLSHDILG